MREVEIEGNPSLGLNEIDKAVKKYSQELPIEAPEMIFYMRASPTEGLRKIFTGNEKVLLACLVGLADSEDRFRDIFLNAAVNIMELQEQKPSEEFKKK